MQVSLGMLAGRTAPPRYRMLHECFGIRSPETFNEDLLRLLDVIIGATYRKTLREGCCAGVVSRPLYQAKCLEFSSVGRE